MKQGIIARASALAAVAAVLFVTSAAFAANTENEWTGVATGNILTGSITVVPEPTTFAMMALGAGLLMSVQRFRRKLR